MTFMRPLERALRRARAARRQARVITAPAGAPTGLFAFVGPGSDTGYDGFGVQPTLYGPLTPRPLGGWPFIVDLDLARDEVQIRQVGVGPDGRTVTTVIEVGSLSSYGPYPKLTMRDHRGRGAAP